MNPLVLPAETHGRIRFFNDVFAVDRRIEFAVGEAACRLTFHPQGAPTHCAFGFQIDGADSGELRVYLSDASVLSGLQTWLDDARLEDVPEELAAVVLDAFLADPLNSMEAQLGESFRLTRILDDGPAGELEYSLPFTLSNDDGRQVNGALQFESGWTSTIRTLISFAPAVPSTGLDDLCLTAPIEVGRSMLSIEELQSLRPFDVVMLQQTELLSRQRVTVRFPERLQMQCVVDGDSLFVNEFCLADPVGPHSGLEDGGGLNDLRLPLHVHTGSVRLPVGQFRQLGPADELAVSGTDRQEVEVFVSGARIASGALIRSGDRLGVRLLSLARSPLDELLSQASADRSITSCA